MKRSPNHTHARARTHTRTHAHTRTPVRGVAPYDGAGVAVGRVWTTQRGPRWREDRAGATVGREGGKVARPGSQPPSACRRVVWATVGSVAHRPLAACRVAPPGSIVPPPTQSPRWSGPAGQISRRVGRGGGAWAGGGPGGGGGGATVGGCLLLRRSSPMVRLFVCLFWGGELLLHIFPFLEEGGCVCM